ncbi:cell division protein ZapD [Ottowia sp.]|uniref:cell division protein ZapD n=1 Tax=Ottowia sp. TaxID=1898956 RepID=UPI002C89F142|nr:cell division protein ZapD [Ottowia sp.]HOB66404.1 cell division protein ZapD [Ottowia sp.]HPZ58290.1 cell division protein ZapD [Ottowia sp.]HQD48709.1 cell division protein ZapD [Ottowia sp.]
MILYEYPFNERVRTYLRLEHLVDRLGQLMARDSALDHHFALITLFEVMDVSGRADLKSDVLKDLERQRTHMAAFRGNPAISEASLDAFLGRVDDAFQQLSQQLGKPGHEMSENEWLMGIRSRAVIPAGTCSFDLPAYHAWQHGPAAARRADLQGWAASLAPMAQAVMLLLQILRDSGRPQKMVATAGQFQQTLPQNRAFQLLRLRVDEALQLVPEISGNRLVASVRLMRQDEDGKLQLAREDAPFELALCA